MKKNVMMRVASALLVAVLMTTCAISGTFAKYTTTAAGSDAARVAKWDIKVNDATVTNTFTFDLFNTVNDTLDGNTEGNISATDGSIIAPGTKGSFDIVLTNASEVTAEYVIAYSVKNDDNIPVKFSLDGTNWETDITKLNVTSPIEIAIGASASKITVHWMWEFEIDAAGNTTDTNLGYDGDAEIQVTATVTANQVN